MKDRENMMETKNSNAMLKGVLGKVGIILMVIAVLTAAVYGQYNGWLERQPKFHDVTMELGEALPENEAFMTEYAKADKVRLLTQEVDLTKVGSHSLEFAHGGKKETVVLTIQDTTAPKVEFKNVAATVYDEVKPEDLVASVEELSAYTITFQTTDMVEDYGDVTVHVQVTDEYGNVTTGESVISYRWMREQFSLELGRTLRSSMLIFGGAEDAVVIDPAQIDAINAGGVGTYTVVSTIGDMVNECVITVKDTTGPRLTLRDVAVYIGETAELEDFVASATDLSGDVVTRLVSPLSLEEAGTYTVQIEAEDIYGNITIGEAELQVLKDTTPPEFFGVNPLPVDKNSIPDYYTGVTVIDDRDGEVRFWVDSSRVDTTRAGTYYAIYNAVDSAGNSACYRRLVSVMHSAEDTEELAVSIAATLSNNVEEIRDYVRNTIRYSYDWGGEDPVWHGFTTLSGNCYVHARCFQALLRAKGYETMIIWVEDQTHYWNLVKIDGVWRHMDSTPDSVNHTRYSIMTDEMRYETLSGRDWNRSAWPAAE